MSLVLGQFHNTKGMVWAYIGLLLLVIAFIGTFACLSMAICTREWKRYGIWTAVWIVVGCGGLLLMA